MAGVSSTNNTKKEASSSPIPLFFLSVQYFDTKHMECDSDTWLCKRVGSSVSMHAIQHSAPI